MPHTFQREIQLPVSVQTAFNWHSRPGALQRLIPPWENVVIKKDSKGIEPGSTVELSVSTPIGRKLWVAEHAEPENMDGFPAGTMAFMDIARKSPFQRWEHEHIFQPDGENCRLIDRITFEMPFESFGGDLGKNIVRNKLNGMFDYRHAVTRNDLTQHESYQTHAGKRVLISGGTGLVGQALKALLTTGGHEVVILTRKADVADKSQIEWSPKDGKLEKSDLEGFDAVVHLAGANLAEKRWTPTFKKVIRDSRVQGTQLLATRLSELNHKPSVFISASATGFYGNRGDEELDETSSPGDNFVASVGIDWEQAAEPARQAGIRVVHPRIGVVLTPEGGGLEKLLTPFRLGAGGPLGSGKQYWSWISIDDAIYAIYDMIMNEEYTGPVNLVSPAAVRVKEFSRTLGKVLSRPSFMPAPGFALKAMLGQMADELLLASVNVRPAKLLDTNFTFAFPELEQALRHLLGVSLQDR